MPKTELTPALLSCSDDLLPCYPERYPPVAAWVPLEEDRVRRVWAHVAAQGRPINLYVHIPFCRRICRYCAVIYRRRLTAPDELERYGEAVAREAALWSPVLKGARVRSVFLGGGTPSLLEPAGLSALIGALRRSIPGSCDAWLGLEANPESLDAARLDAMKLLGVDYLSVGVQSFEDAVLEKADRSHDAAQAWEALELARARSSARLNVDLMAGLPGQTREGFLRDIRALCRWKPDSIHLAYFKPSRFTLAAHGRETPCQDEPQAWRSWVEQGLRYLESHGYRRKSEFIVARVGRLKRRPRPAGVEGPELGLGAGAFSQAGGSFMSQNIATPRSYQTVVSQGRIPVARGWASTPRQEAIAFLLSRWRTCGTVDAREFRRVLGAPLEKLFAAEVGALRAQGVIERRGHDYRVLPRMSADLDLTRALYEPEVVERLSAAFPEATPR